MPEKISILIVEDEAIIALSLREELEMLGFSVAAIVHKGEDALATAQKHCPNLVLMDLNLRGKQDGVATALQLRTWRPIPIIFLTGAADRASQQRIKSVKSCSLLLKPFHIKDLQATIAQSLANFEPFVDSLPSEALYQRLFEISTDGILITDFEGAILDSNPALQNLLGYTAEEIKQHAYDDLCLPEFRTAIDQAVEQQVLPRGYSDEISLELLRSDGARIPVNTRILAREDGNGQVVGYRAMARDLSSLQRSREALLESEQNLRLIVEKSPNGLSLVTTDGSVTVWNQALAEITALPAAQALGQKIWDLQYQLTPTEDRSIENYNALRRRIQTNLAHTDGSWMNTTLVQEIETRYGERKTVEWIGYAIGSGPNQLMGGIIRDITQRIASEQKISRQAHFSQKLNELMTLIKEEGNLDSMLRRICVETVRALEVTYARISLYHPKQDRLVTACANDLQIPSLSFGKAITKSELEEYFKGSDRLYQISLDVQDEYRDCPEYSDLVKADIRTVVIVKLEHQTQLIGTLDLATTARIRSFNEEEINFLTAFARYIAVTIDNTRLYQNARRHAENLELLASLSTELRQVRSRQEMLPILVSKAVALTQADAGVIYLLAPDRQIIATVASPDLHGAEIFWFQPQGDLWQQALTASTPLTDSPTPDLPNTAGCSMGLRLLVPLRTEEALAAMLVLGFAATKDFLTDHQEALRSLADIGANALHRSGMTELLERRVADRTKELSTLYDLTILVNSPLGLEIILNETLSRVIQAVGASCGAIWNFDEKSHKLQLINQVNLPAYLQPFLANFDVNPVIESWLYTSKSPSLITKGSREMATFTVAGGMDPEFAIKLPIRFEGKLLGLLIVLWLQPWDMTVENITLLSAIAERLGSAMQNDRLRRHAESMAVLEERQRLARELHDSVTQSLYSLTLMAEAGKDLLQQDERARLQECLKDLAVNAQQALKDMRLLLFELRSSLSSHRDLVTALKDRLDAVERRAGVRAKLEIDDVAPIPSSLQEDLFRIACESLNNSLKHSGADSVEIRLLSTPDRIQFIIEDNGCGFDPQKLPAGGMGLSTMRERVERLGGSFKLFSRIGVGTLVEMNIPLRGEQDG